MKTNDDIFFHEDDYCQIELLPIQNLVIKRNEINLTQDTFQDNFTGDGFIEIFSRAETIYPLDKLNVRQTDFESILEKDALFYFDKVYTGYSTERIFKNNVHGFGFENHIIYYEFSDAIITKSWIVYYSFSDTLNGYPEKLENTLLKLGEIYNFVLVDWNELTTVILKNKTALIDYLT